MAGRIFLLLLATFVFEARSQLCGCGGPGPLFPGSMLPQLAPALPCMGPIAGPSPFIAEPYIAAPLMIPQPIIAPPYQCYPNVVATTVVDNTVSNSLANAIQLLIVSNLIENTLNAGLLPGNIANLCETVINPGPYADFTEIIPLTQSIVPNCLCQTPVLETVGPICGCDMPYNYVIPEIPIQPMFGPSIPTISPLAAEVLFPSEIPAQLTCNFGYMNTNVPCVSVNVEPLTSFDCCGPNFFNNGYIY